MRKPTYVKGRYWLAVTLLVLSLGLGSLGSASLARAEDSRYFPETGQTLSGKFLDYWQSNGGLPIFGYPISAAQNQLDPETGKTFLTQWFERNRFELHPENAGTKYEVLLGLLGKDLRREALGIDTDFVPAVRMYQPGQVVERWRYFEETRHNLKGRFLTYWEANGGLERFGYPVSEETLELDLELGKVRVRQWFERARFEYHPENEVAYEVQLGLLGNEIKRPSSKIEFAWHLGPNYQFLKQPESLAIDTKDNIYAVNARNYVILKFDNAGRFLRMWGHTGEGNGEFNSLDSIIVDRQGQVYVADSRNNRIQKFDSNGQFLDKIDRNNSGYSKLTGPDNLAVDSQGNLYVHEGAQPRVVKFDSQGKFVGTVGSLGVLGQEDGQFGWISETHPRLTLAVDSQDNLYVADSSTYRIQKFDSQGHFLLKWGSYGTGNGQFYSIGNLAVDRQDNLYVPSQSQVQKFDSQGHFLLKWGSDGLALGQFANFGGIGVDSRGNIYIGDWRFDLPGRLQKFRQRN